MSNEALNFLKREFLCVLSVILEDGTPHGATVHYSFEEEPLKLYIQTSNTTVKAKPFLNGSSGKAAVTIGFSEKDWITLQMSGEIRLASPERLSDIQALHYARHPGAKQYDRPDTIFLEFKPLSWKYSDFNTDPVTVLTENNL